MPDENQNEPVEYSAEAESLNLSKDQLNILVNKLLESSKETLRIVLESLKSDGIEALDKGKQFSKAANMLMIDLVGRKITYEEYQDGMENLALAMDAYLISQGYEKSRKYLAIVMNMLKNMIGTVVSALI